MPFTPAHAAAALPIRWLTRRIPLDALVVGAMAPDFEYLMRLAPHGGFGHSPRGALLFCLPVSLLVVLAYRMAVRPAAVDLLPPAARPSALPGIDPGALFGVALGALLGTATHLFWDGFTHIQGFFVQQTPWMREPFLGIARYRIGQHASTVLGGAALLLAAHRWWRSRGLRWSEIPADRGRRILRAAGMVAVGGAGGAVMNGARALHLDAPRALAYAAVGGLIGLGAGMLAAGIRYRPRP